MTLFAERQRTHAQVSENTGLGVRNQRDMQANTAELAGHDPDRISFVAALRIARHSVIKGDFPPAGTAEAEVVWVFAMNTLERRLNSPRR